MKRRPKDWKTYDKITARANIAKQDELVSHHHHNAFLPKNDEQKRLARAIRENQIIFCDSIAGTGKTHVSIALALEYLNKGEIDRIILARAAVEGGGEKIGYLPGNIEEKMDGFLRPIYDEFEYYLTSIERKMYQTQGIIEICPFAYLRGRTFNNCFIICDEAQNCNPEQLRMILTRIGHNSKLILVGDSTQSDLPYWKQGGFEDYMDRLEGIEDIAMIYLDGKDVIRNPLIGKIIKRLEEEEKNPYDRKSFK